MLHELDHLRCKLMLQISPDDSFPQREAEFMDMFWCRTERQPDEVVLCFQEDKMRRSSHKILSICKQLNM